MKTFVVKRAIKLLTLPIGFSMVLAGCDGSSAMITEATSADGVENSTTVGSATTVAVDNVVVSNPVSNDASTGMGATDLIAERTVLGPVKIMAVGDSITQGVVGAASYRREFSALMDAASCDFTMVGSQETSLAGGGDPNCIDTGVIGDGWGWDGEQSCLVGVSSDAEVYVGAHEGYSSHRADHFLTGHESSTGSNEGIRVAMETYTPDVVLLHVGSVDMYHEQSVESTLEDINDMLDAIYEIQPDTLVLMANIIPWYSENPYPQISQDIASLGDGVEAIAVQRNNSLLKLVDVRAGYSESMMMNDLIHPNIIGEAHIADAFMSVYQPLANCAVR